LAEDTLTLFYEARDAIQYIRSMFGHSGEGKTREPGPDESADEKRILDDAFVTYERFNNKREVFNKIQALQYRFMAAFDKENSKPFDKILKIIKGILDASQLVGEFSIEIHRGQVAADDKVNEQIREFRRAIRWDRREEDPTYVKVNETIEEIESVCKQIINKPTSKPTLEEQAIP